MSTAYRNTSRTPKLLCRSKAGKVYWATAEGFTRHGRAAWSEEITLVAPGQKVFLTNDKRRTT
jgi:hypothetical protein